MPKTGAARKQECRERLLSFIKPGDTIYCILRHVSRSGMQREISLLTSDMRNIDYLVSPLLGNRIGKHNGLVIGGCGMDMGFSLVYSLGYALFPDGFGCVGKSCPSSDHSNGDRDYSPHRHKDGGYALRHRWI